MGSKSAEKTMQKEVPVEADLIVATVKEIGALDKETAFEVVPSLLESAEFSYFKLGGVLSAIYDNDWWVDAGYAKFKEFIPGAFGLHHRKAFYLINIYDALVESGIPWDKVSGLGWCKLSKIAKILTLDNVDEWVARANSMTTLNLAEAVKAFNAGELSTEGTTAPDSSGVSTITFKVHPDQKETINEAVDKAMEEAETEFRGVAIEAVCLNYLAGGTTKKVKTPSLKATMEQHTVEAVFEAFEAIWPEINITAEME